MEHTFYERWLGSRMRSTGDNADDPE